jgi:hypothetical protein
LNFAEKRSPCKTVSITSAEVAPRSLNLSLA